LFEHLARVFAPARAWIAGRSPPDSGEFTFVIHLSASLTRNVLVQLNPLLGREESERCEIGVYGSTSAVSLKAFDWVSLFFGRKSLSS
jgi:hypothetical protein